MFAIKTGVDLNAIQLAGIANEVTSSSTKMLRVYSRYAPACRANIKDVKSPPMRVVSWNLDGAKT